MSDINTLQQLAAFRATSPLAADDRNTRDNALRVLTRGLETHRPPHRRVSDLLAVVMALSARTRRMLHPRVEIEVDVFAPNGSRAVQIYFPQDNAVS